MDPPSCCYAMELERGVSCPGILRPLGNLEKVVSFQNDLEKCVFPGRGSALGAPLEAAPFCFSTKILEIDSFFKDFLKIWQVQFSGMHSIRAFQDHTIS